MAMPTKIKGTQTTVPDMLRDAVAVIGFLFPDSRGCAHQASSSSLMYQQFNFVSAIDLLSAPDLSGTFFHEDMKKRFQACNKFVTRRDGTSATEPLLERLCLSLLPRI